VSREKQPKQMQQMTEKQFDAAFPDDDACKAYLAAHRWPDGPRCPRCGNDKVYPLPSRPFHWQCEKCHPHGYRFSVLVGTIFENTNASLRDWFKVIHLMLVSKKGMSARQLHRYMGFGSYKTAWYMGHRIRAGLAHAEFRELMGIVEVAETFIGGKAKNRHVDKRGKGEGTGGGGSGKIPVVGAVSRKGNIVARVITRVNEHQLTRFINDSVSEKVSIP
jgi:transposase-like protein